MPLPRSAAVRARLLLTVCLLTAPACGAATGPNFPPQARILFIGNSLTYEDSLPEKVAAILAQMGDTGVVVRTVGFPNFALEDHWNEGTAPALLRAERWDYVVMQQGPSTLDESREQFVHWARQFEPLIRGAGAVPVIYEVWPSLRTPERFVLVDSSYRTVARELNGLYAPAGNAWFRVLDTDFALGAELYEVDAFHPTPMGTYLAALVIAARLKDRSPEQVPDVAPGLTLPPRTVRTLQAAAAYALEHSPAWP